MIFFVPGILMTDGSEQPGSSGSDQTGTEVATWYKVPYLTENHFIEVYSNVTYFTSIPSIQRQKSHYKRKAGDIKGISPKSRVRALQLLNMVDPFKLRTPHFVTLTYHDEYPKTAPAIKKDLDTFLKRFRRAFPSAYYFWRVELQARGAPHYHMIVWFPACEPSPTPGALFSQIRTLWLDFTLCACRHCHSHSVRCDLVDNPKQAAYYVSKYLAKSEDQANKIGLGRLWGNSRNLPLTQKALYYGCKDFITALQFSCIVFQIQYSLANPDYLISLLCRPSAFLFIPDQVVRELQSAINDGCEDPVSYVANKLSFEQKRNITFEPYRSAAPVLCPATFAQLTPPAKESLPDVQSTFLYKSYVQLCHYSAKRNKARKFQLTDASLC
jgi:hypothetical protein